MQKARSGPLPASHLSLHPGTIVFIIPPQHVARSSPDLQICIIIVILSSVSPKPHPSLPSSGDADPLCEVSAARQRVQRRQHGRGGRGGARLPRARAAQVAYYVSRDGGGVGGCWCGRQLFFL